MVMGIIKNNMNTPQFKIHGQERRKLKKEYSALKSYIKGFWHWHTMDKDIASIYGSSEGYPMTDESAQKIYDIAKLKLENIEKQLSIPY